MTSAIDNRTTELREKLTELDVKWWPMRNNGYYEDRDTEFVVNGKKYTAHEWGDGLAVYNLTPEQAIAATLDNEVGWRSVALGLLDSLEKADLEAAQKWIVDNDLLREELAYGDAIAVTLGKTCNNEWAEFGKFRCSECWTQVDAISTNTTQPMPIRYCPNCGRKIVTP